MVGLRAELQEFGEGAAHVAEQAAVVLPGEAVADGGVESKAEGAEKGAVVDGAVVRIYDVVRGYDFECQIDVDGYLGWRARPLPEPAGRMPRAVAVPQRPRAVSLTVPSPPQASTPW